MTSELADIMNAAKDLKEFDVDEVIRFAKEKLMNKFSVHFGQPYINNSTVAGMYRIMLKEIAETCNIAFPLKQDRSSERKTPWWYEETR